jgi:hypothetical protein
MQFDPFSDENKISLFGSLDKIKPSIEMLKHQKGQANIWIFSRNKQIANDYRSYKREILENMASRERENSRIAHAKCKMLRDMDHEKTKLGLNRGEMIKTQVMEEKFRIYKAQKDYMTKFFWIFLIKIFRVLHSGKKMFDRSCMLKRIEDERTAKAICIQRMYRRREGIFVQLAKVLYKQHSMRIGRTYDHSTPKAIRTAKIYGNGFHFVALHMRQVQKPKLTQTLATFFKETVTPWRMLSMQLQHILIIKRIQKSFKKHLAMKKHWVSVIENAWSKELMRLVDKEQEYKEMGLNYDLDNMNLLNTDVRVAICTHIVERQILEYIDEKYEVMEEKNDQNLASNIKMLNTALDPDALVDFPSRDTKPLNPQNNTASDFSGLKVDTPPRKDSGMPIIRVERSSGNFPISKKYLQMVRQTGYAG